MTEPQDLIIGAPWSSWPIASSTAAGWESPRGALPTSGGDSPLPAHAFDLGGDALIPGLVE